MDDVLKKVRKIEIKSRGLSNQIFAGKYLSAFKGRGMAFSEVREYQPGDDIRDIDWNVTARSSAPHVKVYEEERELTVMLVVDVSGSRMFGSTANLKKSVMTEIAAVLAFSATQNNDKVGCLFFSDRVEKFIPPKKGRSHVLMIIRELVGFTPAHKGTNLSEAFRFLTNALKKRAIAFVLSDFMEEGMISGASGQIDSSRTPQTPKSTKVGFSEDSPKTETFVIPFEGALQIASRKHDMVAVRVYDQREVELPDVGLIELSDAETGERAWVDSSSASIRKAYAAHWARMNEGINKTLSRSHVDHVMIATDEDYVKSLMKLFKRR